MLKSKQYICILFAALFILTLALPAFAENSLDNTAEQQNTVFRVQVIGGSVIAIVVIIILIINRGMIFKNTGKSSDVIDEDKTVDKIFLTDPDFSREPFREYAGKTLIAILGAITKRNPSLLRLFESDLLYTAHDKQIREYIESKRTNHLDDITLISVKFADFDSRGDTETLTVRAIVSLLDYTTEDVSGGTLDGSRLARRNRAFKLDFIRTGGIKSTEKIGYGEVCPVCGKPLSVTPTGKCSECKAVLCDGSRGWILNSLVKWGHET